MAAELTVLEEVAAELTILKEVAAELSDLKDLKQVVWFPDCPHVGQSGKFKDF